MLTYDAVRRSWLLSDEQLAKANEAMYVLAIETALSWIYLKSTDIYVHLPMIPRTKNDTQSRRFR